MPLSFTNLSLASAVAACFGYAASFVLSLYLGSVRLPRDHPTTVKRRVLAVSILTVLSPPSLLLLADNTPLTLSDLLETIGVQYGGILFAIIYPVTVVSLLYLGSIIQRATDEDEDDGIFFYLQTERRDLLIRNFIIAPVAEEIVFRSCMVPLLLPHLGQDWTIILCPLFFGVAHLHHMFEHLKAGTLTVSQALINIFVQTAYTSLFGMFSAHLFLLTGHVTSAIVAHVMCNILGLPDIAGIRNHRYKLLVSVLYVFGLSCFTFSIYSTWNYNQLIL